MTSYADRSRLLEFHRCPRARWYGYEIPTGGEVGGIQSAKLNMNLLVGSCFHAGIEMLLYGNEVDIAVEYALGTTTTTDIGFWPQVKSSGLILDSNEDASYVAHEQAALIETLIRAYAKFCLPQLLERFTIVEVEREERARFSIPGFDLTFGARVDALLMEKESLDLYALSLKTAKEWGKRDDDSARHDMQGLSEVRVIEQRLAGWQELLLPFKDGLEADGGDAVVRSAVPEMSYPGMPDYIRAIKETKIPEWFLRRFLAGAPPTLMGVKMEFALKGRRSEYPKDSGKWSFSSPLIHPWKQSDDLAPSKPRKSKSPAGDMAKQALMSFPYAVKYNYQDAMGGNHTLGKGWRTTNIWEDMGVKEWIEILATQEIQGFPAMSILASQFVLPIEYFRNEEDMERWERQILFQERMVTSGKEILAEPQTNTEFESTLDEYFPMHTRSCDWPSKCQYQEICFGPKAYLFDPLASGLYQIRTPNHRTEIE